MHELLNLSRQGFKQLNQYGRKVLLLYVIALVFISFLDGAAILLIARIMDSSKETTMDLATSTTISVIGIVALFVTKSIFSALATWITFKEFAKQEVDIGQKRYEDLLHSPIDLRLSLEEGDYYNAIDRGPTVLVQNFLISVASILAESLSGLVILSVVFYLQPTTAVSSCIFFGFIAYMQHILLSRTQSRSGHKVVEKLNSTYRLLNDFFNLSKVIKVHGTQSLEESLRGQRNSLAMARFKLAFVSSLPRYFMESMLAVGLIVIALVSWITRGEEAVLPSLVIFIASGFRLLPIINRIQGLILTCIGYAPLAKLGLGDYLPDAVSQEGMTRRLDPNLTPGVLLELKQVSYTYPNASSPAIINANFRFELGKQYAIVGPSGSGKTTLVDICLSVLTPQKGIVLESNSPAPRFAYVPQDTFISSSNFYGNVALEWNTQKVDENKARQALAAAELGDFLGLGGDLSRLDEKMMKMSGGQRQRLGLARALYQDCNFLVLDEATSALDASTESQVMDTINQLRNYATVVIVAHRLSTVKNADCILYVENGQIIGTGNFMDLQKNLPQFEEQVRLGKLDLINE